MRPIVKKILLALVIAAPALAQSGATGNWSGTYTFSVQLSSCSNKTFTASGPVSITLLQTGTSISGRIDLTNFISISNNCTATTIESTKVIVGTLSGTAIAWSIPNDPNSAQFSGTFDGATIAALWTDANGASGSLTLTRPASDPPTVDITGAWTGTYNFTDQCSNGRTISYSGAMAFGVTQSGADAGGVITLKAVPLYDQNCNTLTALDTVMSAGGVVSGANLAGGAFDPYGSFDFPFTAALTSSTMSGTVAGANATSTKGTFTLTRNSTTPPVSDVAGTYEGTYTEADNESFKCINVRFLTYSGDASLTITQAGNTVSGWLTFHNALDVASDGFGNCVAVNVGDSVMPVYGTIDGDTVTLDFPFGGGVVAEFVVRFSGNTVNGTIADSVGDQAVFTATRTSIASQPRPRRRAAQP